MSRKTWYQFWNGLGQFTCVMGIFVLPFTALLSVMESREKVGFCLVASLICYLASVAVHETLEHFVRRPWRIREMERHIRFCEYRPAYEFREFGKDDLDFLDAPWKAQMPPQPHERYYHSF